MSSDQNVERARGLFTEGEHLTSMGDYKGAVERIQDGIAILLHGDEIRHSVLLMEMLVKTAHLYEAMGDIEGALRMKYLERYALEQSLLALEEEPIPIDGPVEPTSSPTESLASAAMAQGELMRLSHIFDRYGSVDLSNQYFQLADTVGPAVDDDNTETEEGGIPAAADPLWFNRVAELLREPDNDVDGVETTGNEVGPQQKSGFVSRGLLVGFVVAVFLASCIVVVLRL